MGWARARGITCREPKTVNCSPSTVNGKLSEDGLVQEGPEADRAAGEEREPRARGALGQVPVLRRNHLQQGPGGDDERVPEVRASFPPGRAGAAARAVRRRLG